jgi:drug/metabolite transporter (DMT)-like permease
MFSFVGATWGASYLFIKIGLDGGLSPAAVAFVRTALSVLALAPIALSRGGFAGIRAALAPIALLAVIEVGAPFLLINTGEQWISSGLAGVLIASVPVWTALLALRLDRAERPTRHALAGIVVGLVGVGLVLGVDLSGGGKALLGGLMVVLAGLGYAISGFVIKRLAHLDMTGMVTAMMAIGALISLPGAALAAPSSVPDAGVVAAMLALGVVGTGLSFVVFYALIGRIGPARASLVTYVSPGFAVFYGVGLYGERLTAGVVAGLALIVGGSWLAGRGDKRDRAHPGRSVAAAESPAAAAADA